MRAWDAQHDQAHHQLEQRGEGEPDPGHVVRGEVPLDHTTHLLGVTKSMAGARRARPGSIPGQAMTSRKARWVTTPQARPKTPPLAGRRVLPRQPAINDNRRNP